MAAVWIVTSGLSFDRTQTPVAPVPAETAPPPARALAAADYKVRTGTCSDGASWRLGSTDLGNLIKVRFEIYRSPVGHSWRIVLHHVRRITVGSARDDVFFRSTMVAAEDGGVVAQRRVRDWTPIEWFEARAVDTQTGQRCKGDEFHGNQAWGGSHHWKGKTPTERITAYLEVMDLLDTCYIDVAYASINKAALHDQYDGAHDDNAYRLALQFRLEKVDRNLGDALKVLVADEAREQAVQAIRMVADMQQWGVGEAPSRKHLSTVIDSLHFVRSDASPGVQTESRRYTASRRPAQESEPVAVGRVDVMSV